jgi:tRNA1Val (adenine37-N6)-methyltransferase
MKVGTDAVLLGSWVNCTNSKTILDVGTGCGVIALMLAQRCSASVHAIDIHRPSVIEAEMNFKNSDWNNRLTLQNIAFQQFRNDLRYDLIVSNPPFFRNCLKVSEPARNNARHDDTLPFEALIEAVMYNLSTEGIFALVLPAAEFYVFERLAAASDLFPERRLMVHTRKNKPALRILAEFRTGQRQGSDSSIDIYDENGAFTSAYKQLTKDFYLDF